jgi:predicted Holliday junction resolvase-like endonuclease
MEAFTAFSPAQWAYLAIVAAILAVILLVLGLYFGLRLGRRSGRLEAEAGLRERIVSERDDAVKRSRAILGGLAAEQLAPYLPGFPFDLTELRFIGKPVDFIAFVGASKGKIDEIAFVEVKSGNASLSPVERSLRDAVKDGRVRWTEYRTPEGRPIPLSPNNIAPPY